MIYITIAFYSLCVKNNFNAPQLIRSDNIASYCLQTLQRFLMRMAVAVAAPAGNHRQPRAHLLQKFHTAAVMRTVVSCLQHSVLLQLQPSLAFFPHVTCKQHAALRAMQRRQRAGFVTRHSLLRYIN